MLPPVLEIYVVWHPADHAGRTVAEELMQHFHGSRYAGLLGGAVEVFVRYQGWRGPDDAPRPIPTPTTPPPNGLRLARLTVVVPVLGLGLARAVQPAAGPWYAYACGIVNAAAAAPDRVAIFPVVADPRSVDRTVLGGLFDGLRRIGRRGLTNEPERDVRCRDLAQGISQFAGGLAGEGRLTVFISHTKLSAPGEQGVAGLIDRVRSIIGHTQLTDFFAPHDLQPGDDWSRKLTDSAAKGALLALRTGLYASRTWCQREMLVAKRAGMPVVILDAIADGEERGSFLMDHVQRIPVRSMPGSAQDADIRRGLNVLVDECLQRVLWRHQQALATELGGIDVAWWAPHAPEPATLAHWLVQQRSSGGPISPVRILHPDPPLGPDEIEVLEQMAQLAGLATPPDILTPRSLAARSG